MDHADYLESLIKGYRITDDDEQVLRAIAARLRRLTGFTQLQWTKEDPHETSPLL